MSEPSDAPATPSSPFADLAAFVALPRISGLALSADGRRLAVAVQTLDREKTKWQSALWEVDPEGRRPTRRLTRSAPGESSPVWAPDGSLLFASARPDAGVAGSGMALPAITIAVLGGVAITGGIGRVAGVVLATLLVVWLNAGILLAVPGNAGSQFQLFALGAVLVFAALLNGLTTRRYGAR